MMYFTKQRTVPWWIVSLLIKVGLRPCYAYVGDVNHYYMQYLPKFWQRVTSKWTDEKQPFDLLGVWSW